MKNTGSIKINLTGRENLSVSPSNKKFGSKNTNRKEIIKKTISTSDNFLISSLFTVISFELNIQKPKNKIMNGKDQIL